MAAIDTLDKLEQAAEEDDIRHPFGPYQEEAIVSLALDHPQFFTAVGRFMRPEMFSRIETQWVMAEILNAFDKYDMIPTRDILYDQISRKITEDDPFEEVLGLVRRKSNPREIPMVKDTLLKWARDRSFGLLYSDEAIEAYRIGNYSVLEKIVNEANRIADISDQGLWLFENLEILFQPDIIEHRTTGFPKLDKMLNNGGPSPKEVVCWLAGTNVGKCHTLQSKIIEKNLSRIFKVEFDDGTTIELAGFKEVQTTRGMVKVCDLTDADDITELPIETDGAVEMSDLRISDAGKFSFECDDDAFA